MARCEVIAESFLNIDFAMTLGQAFAPVRLQDCYVDVLLGLGILVPGILVSSPTSLAQVLLIGGLILYQKSTDPWVLEPTKRTP